MNWDIGLIKWDFFSGTIVSMLCGCLTTHRGDAHALLYLSARIWYGRVSYLGCVIGIWVDFKEITKVLGALLVAANGIRNKGAWVALGLSWLHVFSTLMAPHAWLVMLLSALWWDLPSLPTRVGSMSNDEGQHVEAPCSTWCPKAMAEEGYGGQRWTLMIGGNMWCWPYAVVHGIGGLVAGFLCVGLVALVKGKVRPLWWTNAVCKALD